jgi:predicted peptidase
MHRPSIIYLLVALGFALSACQAPSPPPPPPRPTPANVDGFLARNYTARNVTMPYRLWIPPSYDSAAAYPLIVWLHGAGGSGDDNVKQVSGDQIPGTHVWTTPAAQATHPAFVVAPQARSIWSNPGHPIRDSPTLLAVLGVVKAIQEQYHIDPRRIYIAGQSLGGGGAWTLITSTPNPFAAAIILCGVYPDTLRAKAAASVPIWVFQGAQDTPTIVGDARAMIAALKKAGGSPRYTEYPDLDHNIWTRVFQDPGLGDWLFAQHR